MIYTLTFNPSLDYMVEVKDFKSGMVNRTRKEKITIGGKGINVSVVAKNLGYKSIALGFVAGFTGKEINKELRKRKIETMFVELKEGMSRINVKLCLEEESEINGQGPNIGKEDMDKLYKKLDNLLGEDILILAGSVPEGIKDTIYMDIMKRIEHKRLKVVVDASKDLLVNTLNYKPFLVKPNNHELGEIFGVEIKNKEEAIKYGKKLKEKGAKNVLVSLASEGAVLIAEDGNVYEAAAPKGKVINSVGAGDSMVAGFIVGYRETKNYKEALKMGISAGSASAFLEDLATKEDVDKIIKTVNIDVK